MTVFKTMKFGDIDEEGNIGGPIGEMTHKGQAYVADANLAAAESFGWKFVRRHEGALSVVERGIIRLTVAELRAAIAELPDDMIVCASSQCGGDHQEAEGTTIETYDDGKQYLLVS